MCKEIVKPENLQSVQAHTAIPNIKCENRIIIIIFLNK